jgi:nitrate reductase NapD
MNISGVVVRTFPGDIERVTRSLSQLDGVEVHGASGDGRLVVTVEQFGDRLTADTLTAMQGLPGVLSASMIYHQFEELGPEETEQ